MPIPDQNKTEDSKEFLKRCMSDSVMKKEYPDPKQRVAVCLSRSKGISLIDDVALTIVATTFEWDDIWDEFTFTIDVETIYDSEDHVISATKNKKKVTLNKPFRTPDGPKKFSVYVKNDKGNVVKVNFGDPNMKIKKNIPERRKSFRARHNCDNPGPKWKARYWSCKAW